MKKLIISIIAFIALLFFFLSPTKQLDESIEEKESFLSMVSAKDESTFSASLEESGIFINYEFNEEEWTQYLTHYVKLSDSNVEAVDVEFQDELITIYINQNNFVPLQYKIELAPKVDNGELVLEVKSTQVGRLPIPKSFVVNNMEMDKNSSIQLKGGNIYLQLPDAIVFETVEAQDGALNATVSLNITSLFDVVDIINVLLPEDFMENLPF